MSLFKRKRGLNMPTIKEIKELPKEEQTAIFNALKEDLEKPDVKEEVKEETNTEENKEEIVETKDDEIVETVNKELNSEEAKLEKAILIEMEKTDDREIAEKLATEHISEKADYYDDEVVEEENAEVKEESLDERFAKFEKTFEEKTNDAMAKYQAEFDAKYKKLEEENKELKRTQPMGNLAPKPNEGNLRKAEKRDEFSIKYKAKNNQKSQV